MQETLEQIELGVERSSATPVQTSGEAARRHRRARRASPKAVLTAGASGGVISSRGTGRG